MGSMAAYEAGVKNRKRFRHKSGACVSFLASDIVPEPSDHKEVQ